MIATLLVCAWLGGWADEKYQNTKPYFTIGLLLFGVFASLIQIVRSVTNMKEKKEAKDDASLK